MTAIHLLAAVFGCVAMGGVKDGGGLVPRIGQGGFLDWGWESIVSYNIPSFCL